MKRFSIDRESRCVEPVGDGKCSKINVVIRCSRSVDDNWTYNTIGILNRVV